MLRGDNVICGTSTTGTGTLTLAATPGPPGGVDFDVFARACGVGNSGVVLVTYTIIEYADGTFATAKASEKGVGTLTLGSSSGITNCTLARTKMQSSITSMNAQPATQNFAPVTGISIGTAANTLVFISPSTAELLAFEPFYEGIGTSTGWVGPLAISTTQADGSSVAQTTGMDYYIPFIWIIPMLVKTISIQVKTSFTTGTSNLYARIYQVGTDGRPGRLLVDFGVLGTAGSSTVGNSNADIINATPVSGFVLVPGVYYLDILGIFSGTTGGPHDFYGAAGKLVAPFVTGVDYTHGITNGYGPIPLATASGGSSTAPLVANKTAYTIVPSGGTSPSFVFRAS